MTRTPVTRWLQSSGDSCAYPRPRADEEARRPPIGCRPLLRASTCWSCPTTRTRRFYATSWSRQSATTLVSSCHDERSSSLLFFIILSHRVSCSRLLYPPTHARVCCHSTIMRASVCLFVRSFVLFSFTSTQWRLPEDKTFKTRHSPFSTVNRSLVDLMIQSVI